MAGMDATPGAQLGGTDWSRSPRSGWDHTIYALSACKGLEPAGFTGGTRSGLAP